MTNINVPVLRLAEQGDIAYKKKDYEKAEGIYKQALDLAVQTGAETNYVYSCLAKVYKKLKKYREAYNISFQAIPTPAGFRDCAICLRQLARQAQRAKNDSLFRETLEELYRLAALAYLCYGIHDCKTGVRGSLYDRALILCQKLELRQIHATYQTHGRLDGGGLLTESDYKLFASVFGEIEKNYNPHLDFSALTWEVNNENMKRLREHFLRAPEQHPEFSNDTLWNRMANESIAENIKWLRQNAPFALND
jgi:tetratricopeptide (TPR) repeat protein